MRIQGFRGNYDSQGKLGMCPSLAALYASGFPRGASVFQKAGGYWQDWRII